MVTIGPATVPAFAFGAALMPDPSPPVSYLQTGLHDKNEQHLNYVKINSHSHSTVMCSAYAVFQAGAGVSRGKSIVGRAP
jgi:hypothetical protein